MKYYKRLGLYKMSNVTLDPVRMQAYSYGWWRFVDRIGGLVVFNNYSYSVSTSKHQRRVRDQLEELGIAIDAEIAVPAGLQEFDRRSVEYYIGLINQLNDAMANPRSRHARNAERRAEIDALRKKIDVVNQLLGSRK